MEPPLQPRVAHAIPFRRLQSHRTPTPRRPSSVPWPNHPPHRTAARPRLPEIPEELFARRSARTHPRGQELTTRATAARSTPAPVYFRHRRQPEGPRPAPANRFVIITSPAAPISLNPSVLAEEPTFAPFPFAPRRKNRRNYGGGLLAATSPIQWLIKRNLASTAKTALHRRILRMTSVPHQRQKKPPSRPPQRHNIPPCVTRDPCSRLVLENENQAEERPSPSEVLAAHSNATLLEASAYARRHNAQSAATATTEDHEIPTAAPPQA